MANHLHCELLISGGTVVDGSGGSAVSADIAVDGDRIVAVGDLTGWTADQSLDATGLVVCPAFIDIHTHSDISALHNPDQLSMLFQGVGTQIVGNCGIGMGQVVDSPEFQYEQKWLRPHGVSIHWSTLDDHLRLVEKNGIGTNYAPLAAHGTIRKKIMNYTAGPPSAGELERMTAQVEEAFEAGCWGLSTGLEYTPAKFADAAEVVALAKVAARYGGFYATHLRDEGDFLVESTEEAIQIADEAGLPLQLSHHKADGRANWGKVRATLNRVEQKRAEGMDILLDQYPYLAYQTSVLVAFFPEWVRATDPKTIVETLSDPAQRPQIKAEVEAKGFDWGNVVLGSAKNNRYLQGHTVEAAAGMMQKDPVEFLMDLLIEEQSFLSAAHFSLSEEDLREVMTYEHTMIGSDAVGTCPHGTMGAEQPHPRSYGTFPRVLGKFVREAGALPLETAVYKMTGLPAKRMGWTDRGCLKPGAFADITLFDPQRIDDISDFADPHRPSVGVQHLLINGEFAIRNGEHTGRRPGRVLRKR